uniref:Metallophos domain-containing protein n=1 Tax=Meloidogyne hapla TaxID=6305 RepID=A0A1I8B101_MELHA
MALENGIIRADPMSHRPVELWKKYLRQVRFVCISDTHEKMDEILDLIPDGDVLIHAGDFTEAGKLPHKVKIVIAGNHELGFEDGEEMSDRQLAGLSMLGIGKAYELLTNCIYLCDRLIEVYGIKIYGAPWHPMPGYSFYRQRGQALLQKWNQIPSKTDVLITHTPPLGHGDFNAWTKLGGMLAGCAGIMFLDTFINNTAALQMLRTEYDPIIFDMPLPYGRSKDEVIVL